MLFGEPLEKHSSANHDSAKIIMNCIEQARPIPQTFST
jgi:hypothetical protein